MKYRSSQPLHNNVLSAATLMKVVLTFVQNVVLAVSQNSHKKQYVTDMCIYMMTVYTIDIPYLHNSLQSRNPLVIS